MKVRLGSLTLDEIFAYHDKYNSKRECDKCPLDHECRDLLREFLQYRDDGIEDILVELHPDLRKGEKLEKG